MNEGKSEFKSHKAHIYIHHRKPMNLCVLLDLLKSTCINLVLTIFERFRAKSGLTRNSVRHARLPQPVPHICTRWHALFVNSSCKSQLETNDCNEKDMMLNLNSHDTSLRNATMIMWDCVISKASTVHSTLDKKKCPEAGCHANSTSS